MSKHGVKEQLKSINNTIAQNYTWHTKFPKHYNNHLNSAIDTPAGLRNWQTLADVSCIILWSYCILLYLTALSVQYAYDILVCLTLFCLLCYMYCFSAINTGRPKKPRPLLFTYSKRPQPICMIFQSINQPINLFAHKSTNDNGLQVPRARRTRLDQSTYSRL